MRADGIEQRFSAKRGGVDDRGAMTVKDGY
jgi:hypothetical protein